MEENIDLALISSFRRSVHLSEERFFPFKGQGRILGILRRHEGRISQSELTELTGLKTSSITELTQKLCLRGLLEKESSERDHRETILTLTAEGWREAERMKRESLRISQESFRVLTEKEKQELISLLGKLNEYWEAER